MLWGIGSNYGCGAKSDEKALNFKREIYGVIGAMMLIKKNGFVKSEVLMKITVRVTKISIYARG